MNKKLELNHEKIPGHPIQLFIDDKDINRFFSDHTPHFKRPDMAIAGYSLQNSVLILETSMNFLDISMMNQSISVI